MRRPGTVALLGALAVLGLASLAFAVDTTEMPTPELQERYSALTAAAWIFV